MLRTLACLILATTCMTLTAAEGSVGVLYIERIFTDSEAVSQVREQLRGQADKVQGTIDEMSDEIEATKAELETLPEGAPARFAVSDKLEVLRLRRKLYAERHREMLGQIEVKLLKSAYAKIREQLATFATDRGLTTVFLGARDQLGASNLQELNLELATHSVLYHAPYLDITADFIEYLGQNLVLDDSAAAPADAKAAE